MPEWLQKIGDFIVQEARALLPPPADAKSVKDRRFFGAKVVSSTAVALTGGGAEAVAARILNPEETQEVISALSSLGYRKNYEIPSINSMI